MMSDNIHVNKGFNFRLTGLAGIILIIIFWYINWGFDGLRTHWAFFPLWLGYILVFDALNYYQKGRSLLSQSYLKFAGLFLISIPAWWLFELIDEYAGLWHYTAIDQFTDLEYALLASLSFSTVIPAVFETSEWVYGFHWISKFKNRLVVGKSSATVLAFFVTGWLLLALLLLVPILAPPFVWIAPFFILDPVNKWRGQPSILGKTARGDWRAVIALWIGVLICGFFWEMWNWKSFPKWEYSIPFAEFWYIFEMPVLGYLGYLPFSLALFAIYHFVIAFVNKNRKHTHFLLSEVD